MTTRNARTTTLPRPPSLNVAAIFTLVAALLVTLAAARPAAADSFRYWGYWQGGAGTWEFAQTGPDEYEVVDRDVQGWRFGISSETATPKPDNAPDFAALCPSLAAAAPPEGQVRVAVVIDSGFVADAPAGQTPPADEIGCVTVPEGSTGTQALSGAATVASQDGLVCSVDAFPEGECGAPVAEGDAEAALAASASESANPATPAAASAEASVAATSEASADSSAAATSSDPGTSDSGSAMPFLIGGALVLIVLLGVVLAARRRGGDSEGA